MMKRTRAVVKLLRQARIPGLRREHASDCFLPVVKSGLDDLAQSEGKTRSRIVAEIVSLFFNLDANTGKPLPDEQRIGLFRLMLHAMSAGTRRRVLHLLIVEFRISLRE